MGFRVIEHKNKENRKTIILIHGAYHGAWCWEENFAPYFLERKINVVSIDFIRKSKKTKVEEYIQYLNKVIEKLEGELYVASHSLGAAILERYIVKYSPKLNGVIFLTPGPFVKQIRRAFVVNVHNIFRNKKRFYFSERLEDDNAERYIEKLKKEPRWIEFLVVRKNIPGNYDWKYKTLILSSLNDQCMPISIGIDAGKRIGAKVIIYENICHDMMLDPEWRCVAEDICHFIQENNGEKFNEEESRQRMSELFVNK
mgnify:CR=1 FL=1|jgi:predicted alpha/beta hydrolase family esterase